MRSACNLRNTLSPHGFAKSAAKPNVGGGGGKSRWCARRCVSSEGNERITENPVETAVVRGVNHCYGATSTRELWVVNKKREKKLQFFCPRFERLRNLTAGSMAAFWLGSRNTLSDIGKEKPNSCQRGWPLMNDVEGNTRVSVAGKEIAPPRKDTMSAVP
jgi:hypothetical protein